MKKAENVSALVLHGVYGMMGRCLLFYSDRAACVRSSINQPPRRADRRICPADEIRVAEDGDLRRRWTELHLPGLRIPPWRAGRMWPESRGRASSRRLLRPRNPANPSRALNAIKRTPNARADQCAYVTLAATNWAEPSRFASGRPWVSGLPLQLR